MVKKEMMMNLLFILNFKPTNLAQQPFYYSMVVERLPFDDVFLEHKLWPVTTRE